MEPGHVSSLMDYDLCFWVSLFHTSLMISVYNAPSASFCPKWSLAKRVIQLAYKGVRLG